MLTLPSKRSFSAFRNCESHARGKFNHVLSSDIYGTILAFQVKPSKFILWHVALWNFCFGENEAETASQCWLKGTSWQARSISEGFNHKEAISFICRSFRDSILLLIRSGILLEIHLTWCNKECDANKKWSWSRKVSKSLG